MQALYYFFRSNVNIIGFTITAVEVVYEVVLVLEMGIFYFFLNDKNIYHHFCSCSLLFLLLLVFRKYMHID